jgi:hypothetical protein
MLALSSKTTIHAATDSDGDGYSDTVEQFIGTNPNAACSSTTTPNDEAVDAWPPDFNDDKTVDLLDGNVLRNLFNSHTGDGVYQKRYDLNADGAIDLLDAQAIRVPYGTTCSGTTTPTPPPSPPPAPTPAPSTPPGGWAFEETFDGAPASPQAYASSRFDMVVGGNDADAIVDGQTILSDPPLVETYGTIQGGHGSDCGAPIGTSANNHAISVDFDPQGFQTNTRPQLAYICNNHLMTTLKSGYAVASLMPRQLFDWSGRTGTIQFDTNVYAFQRSWWDVWVVPEDDMLLEMVDHNEGGAGEQFPERGVRFSFQAAVPRVGVFDNYGLVQEWKNWQGFNQAFPSDPAINDPKTRRTFKLHLSQTGFGFEVQKDDGTFWTFSGSFDQPLPFTRGEIRIEHHVYNPTKDGIFDDPWSQYTYHWDNIRFDGPVVPARRAFEAPPSYITAPGAPLDTPSSTVTINVSSTNQPRLIGHLVASAGMLDPANTTHWAQVQVNGGPWIDVKLRKPIPTDTGERFWSTIDTPLPGIVTGQNRLVFRYNSRPSDATWQWDGFHLKDLEIQTEDRAIIAAAPALPGGTSAVMSADTYGCALQAAALPPDDGASLIRIS